MSCENCGMKEGALTDPGYTVDIVRRAENGFQRNKKTTVWVCSAECGIQALAISEYGSATSKWPITLAQARGRFRRQLCAVNPDSPPSTKQRVS